MGTVERNDDRPPTQLDGESGDIPDNFEELQREDPTLQNAFETVTHVDDFQTEVSAALSGESYMVKNELLYHQPGEGRAEQLVVSKQLSHQALAMGYKIPWAGHLSNTKSHERVAARLYWPGLYAHVLAYCQSDPECQLTSNRKTSPFTHIAMDIVGPLEQTQTGNRYILVICDYGRKASACPIAQALFQLFSRVGIPREVLRDQGTPFLSNTLGQVYGLLGIKGIRTTPYQSWCG